MSSWRYQICRHFDEGGEPYLAIHEYYTLHDGKEAWTLNPVPIEEGNIRELRNTLERIIDDLDRFGVRDIETWEQVDGEVGPEQTG